MARALFCTNGVKVGRANSCLSYPTLQQKRASNMPGEVQDIFFQRAKRFGKPMLSIEPTGRIKSCTQNQVPQTDEGFGQQGRINSSGH